jgi:hypothetical protein
MNVIKRQHTRDVIHHLPHIMIHTIHRQVPQDLREQPHLQPAAAEMAPVASDLIYLTMGKVADYVFGAGKPQQAKQLLARLFRARSNLFSHQFAEVALLSGNVAGLLISYSVRFSNSLELPTA